VILILNTGFHQKTTLAITLQGKHIKLFFATIPIAIGTRISFNILICC